MKFQGGYAGQGRNNFSCLQMNKCTDTLSKPIAYPPQKIIFPYVHTDKQDWGTCARVLSHTRTNTHTHTHTRDACCRKPSFRI